MKINRSGYFSSLITRDQARDSGMAAVLILLLIGLFTRADAWYAVAVAALLMNMVFPMFYYPFAILWFGIARIMGAIMSKVLLIVIYFIILLPVALVRQFAGKDPLLLKGFKKSRESVLKARDHDYQACDLERPF